MKRTFHVALSVIVAGAILLSASARSQDVVIVANKSVTVSHVTDTQLREIFTGMRSRFGDGSPAIPVILKGGAVHEVFLRNHVGETAEEFRLRWRKAVFTGQGAMPKEVTSEAAMLEHVAATPGAVGYVSHLSNEGLVKVLSVSP
jgi:hypothetical protein